MSILRPCNSLFVSCLLGLAGCIAGGDGPSPGIHAEPAFQVQQVSAAAGASASFLAMDLIGFDNNGMAMQCGQEGLSIKIEISQAGPNGPWEELDDKQMEVVCGEAPADVSMVLDNSGSQHEALDKTHEGATQFVDDILEVGGAVAVTRVSTQASSLTGLTDDQSVVQAALDDMFVNNGWTALYDAVRLGNETLGEAVAQQAPELWDNAGDFCAAGRRRSAVVFTNGEDNNSEDQKHDENSDGIDTTIEDLKNLTIAGVTTPMYIVGLGERVDAKLLQDLADASGGYYLGVDEASDLPEAFGIVSDYYAQGSHVCAELPKTCGQLSVRVTYSFDNKETQEKVFNVNVDCPEEAAVGKTATILLTMSNPGIETATAATLAANAVDYVSPTDAPAVLVVRDDNHHDEFSGDSAYVADLLADGGYDVDFMDEPKDGLDEDDVAGYDVVWFSNPGWPMDDIATFDTMKGLIADGVGVVLQGDDMSWSMGNSWSMKPITHLDHDGNGTKSCGILTNDNEGETYQVVVNDGPHPMIAGLEGVSFPYGDDIDHSTPLGEGEEVLAWATVPADPNCTVLTPVLVAYDPN